MQIAINHLKKICFDNHFDSLEHAIASIESILQEKYIDIAILGQFKAGKSSFINSLFGISVMPFGVTPVTSVITRLLFAEKETAKINFLNGRTETINIDDIKNYITEFHNPENTKQVYVVDIALPQLEVYKNIRIIDTPGIGSIFSHNTETTENWFTKIGIAIIAISAERPLSDNDIALIKEIDRHCPHIIILLTKTDLFTKEQINEIAAYIQNSLKKNFQKEFSLIPYSIKNNEAHKSLIFNQILEPLSKNSDENYRQIIYHKIIAIAKSCEALLKIMLQTTTNSEAENIRLKKLIFDEQTNFQFIYKELMLIAQSQKAPTRELVYEIIAKHQPQIIKKLSNDFKIIYNQWKGNLNKRARNYESWIKEEITKAMSQIAIEEHKEITAITEKSKQHFEFYTHSFTERLIRIIEKTLNIKLPPTEWQIETKKLKQADVSVSWAFEFHLDMIWFLFPMFIYKNVFKRYFIRQIPYEVEKNIYRLTSDLSDIINTSIENQKEQSLKYISNELNTINAILSNQKFDFKTINEQLAIINQIMVT